MGQIILTKELDNYFRNNIDKYCIAYLVEKNNNTYKVDYIIKEENGIKPISFLPRSGYFNLTNFERDLKISQFLESTVNDFDVEEIIYTEEQRKKIANLRKNSQIITNGYYHEKLKLEIEYSKSFEEGQKVWYKGQPGIITYKHYTKNKKKYNWAQGILYETEPISRFTVKVRNIEHRYVEGTQLLKRIPEKLDNVPIDENLNKLSTEKLLKMYKAKRNKNYGRGDEKIKVILNQREHIQNGDSIVKIIQ